MTEYSAFSVVQHLEPLAIAANIFQAPTCRLDHVMLTLGNLLDFFNGVDSTEEGNDDVTRVMVASLERRWNKTDQELFILAVFFNPYIHARFFNMDHLRLTSLLHITRRVSKRLTGNDIHDPEFLRAFTDYYNTSGDFSRESMYLDGYAETYSSGSSNGEVRRTHPLVKKQRAYEQIQARH